MSKNSSNPSSRRGLRLALMASTVLVVGLGAAAVLAHETQIGQSLLHRFFARLETKHDDRSTFSNLMDQARKALAQNHPEVAVIFLKNAVTAAPQDSEARLQLGVALLKAGDTVSAERELRNARQNGAADKAVLPALYTAMLARSEDAQLLAEFAAPSDGDKSELASETLRARAAALSKTGKQSEAAASLDRALSFDSSTANLIARAQLARTMGDRALAMKLIDDTLAQAPKNAVALVTKIDLLAQAKEQQKALAAANQLLEYYPDSAEALMTRAGLYLQMNQHDKALADINASLKAAPRMPIGIYYKALAMEQAKDAKQAWDLAQNLPPGFVNSRPEVGSAVSQMAIDAGHIEIGTSILSATVINFPKNIDARIRLAARYLQLNDATRALQTLQPTADSSDPRVLVLFAQAYDMQHQYAKSVEYLEKASATGVGGGLLKRQIAISNLEAGNFDAGLSELQKIDAAAPGDPQTAGPLINALLRKNDYAKAQEVAAKLSSAAPKSPYGPFFEGQLLQQHGDLDGAAAAFSRAITVDSKFVPAMYERGLVLAARGDLDGAGADMRSILANDPSNMTAQLFLAQIEMRGGRKDKAVVLLKETIATHPREALPALTLANIDLQQRDFNGAAAVIADFLANVPDNINALAMQGQIQLAAGKQDQAVATFQRLAGAYPKSPQIQMLLANALIKGGDANGAINAYRQAVQLAPGMPAAHLGLIQLALSKNDSAAALSAAQDYAEKQPGVVSADALARTYVALNRPDDAVKVLRETQAKNPNSATAISLATLLRSRGGAKEADAVLVEWIAKHPEDMNARLAYGDSQLTSDAAAAETQFREVLKVQPYNLDALNNLSWILQSKDAKEALPFAERAAKLAPRSPDVLDTLGWTKWQLGDKSAALDLLKRAHEAQPKEAVIAYHLVVALDGNGQQAEAKKLLGELLASNQNFADRKSAEALGAKWQLHP